MYRTSEVLLHLSLIDDVGPVAINRIVKTTSDEDAWLQLYELSAHELMQRFGFSQRIAQKIVTGLADRSFFENELARAEKHDIRIVSRLDEAYPELLTHIHAAPAVLYIKGAALKKDSFRFAVVGSRRASSYAKRSIEKILEPLLEAGWEIVSGGALGADSMAHAYTVAMKGVTHVILGSGLLRPYPRSNRGLFENMIATSGSLMRSFPLMAEALPGNFPARNRIISGISRGCLVAQAAAKSGASITAYHALEQGREVFTIPGLIDDPLSEGCHRLIQQGAKLVTCADDIAQEFSQQIKLQESEVNIEIERSPLDQQIIGACSVPMAIDDLMEELCFSLDQMQEKLFQMQLDGRLKQNLFGLWERV